MYPSCALYFALSQCPANKVLENLGFVWVLILVVSKPGVGDNGGLLTRWIGDKSNQVIGG